LLFERSAPSPELDSELELDSEASAAFAGFSTLASGASAFTAFARGAFLGASDFSADTEPSATTRRLFFTGAVSWISSMFLISLS
jgi:hypothetical protein